MAMRLARDPGRTCDSCGRAKPSVYFVAWGSKSFRSCHDCFEVLTGLRLQLLTDPEQDSVERYSL